MLKIVVNVPAAHGMHGPWAITYPALKIALKYGIAGPWCGQNWSVAFDTYSTARGPNRGLPTLADFAVTALMNSRVRSVDLKRMSSWLAVDDNRASLAMMREVFMGRASLAEMTNKELEDVGAVIDGMLDDRAGLHGVRRAKVFKWLAAWAPNHVPMIDRHARVALAGPPSKTVPTATLLRNFQTLLLTHREDLEHLVEIFNTQYLPDGCILTPVRALDSVLWFDWWACSFYARDFSRWVRPRSRGSHAVTDDAETWSHAFGMT